ncbi:hypothethical protein (plasmid) [Ralstonia solanacearum PSI07]|nr:hypothethical protein [Ralstonia solanacearum PSI07]
MFNRAGYRPGPRYIDVQWTHTDASEPARLVSELGEN